MATADRSRWFGITLTLIALVLGLGTVTLGAAAAPAHAAPGSSFEQCFPVVDPGTGQIVDWICVPIPVDDSLCPPCPDFAIGFDHLVNPADPWYVEDLARGLGLLGEAAQADPRTAARLRAEAGTAFLASAERLGEGLVRLGVVGYVDHERQVIEPVPEPWLVSAGTDLAAGLTLMQEALVNPDPQPWMVAAMARFDAAFLALASQRAGH
jgi:hypothetical protein